MELGRIELRQRERDRLKRLHQVEQGDRLQVEAARRLRLSDRQMCRLHCMLGVPNFRTLTASKLVYAVNRR